MESVKTTLSTIKGNVIDNQSTHEDLKSNVPKNQLTHEDLKSIVVKNQSDLEDLKSTLAEHKNMLSVCLDGLKNAFEFINYYNERLDAWDKKRKEVCQRLANLAESNRSSVYPTSDNRK